MPKPVERPKAPEDYATTDELYFTGQRIEQLFSPSFEAAPYYEEMLRRDPGDYRANTARGIELCKQWRWAEAAKYLSNAIARATANHIRPKDGEAYYYLGVALRNQAERPGGVAAPELKKRWKADLDAAADAFERAAWSEAWRAASEEQLAEVDCQRSDFRSALDHVERSISLNNQSPKSLDLKSAILRRLERPAEAAPAAAAAVAHRSA